MENLIADFVQFSSAIAKFLFFASETEYYFIEIFLHPKILSLKSFGISWSKSHIQFSHSYIPVSLVVKENYAKT